jgi:acetate---CoA ligase (ADP-forming)
LQAEMRTFLPYYASTTNPVDFTAGVAQRSDMGRTLSIVGRSSRIDVIVVISSLGLNAEMAKESAILYSKVAHESGKPLLTYTYTAPADGVLDAFAEVGVPVYVSQSGIARAVAALARPRRHLTPVAHSEAPDKIPPLPSGSGGMISEEAVKEWLARCGFRLPERHLAADLNNAVAASGRIGYPVALKAQSPALPHKGDSGVIALNLRSAKEVRAAYATIVKRARSLVGDDGLDGVLVEKMVDGGFEMLLGITRHPALGTFLTVGAGGSHAELFADVVTVTAPATKWQIRDVLEQLRCAKVFASTRPMPLDVDAFCQLAARISSVGARSQDLKELDLNPVIVHRAGRGVDIVDGFAVRGASSDQLTASEAS